MRQIAVLQEGAQCLVDTAQKARERLGPLFHDATRGDIDLRRCRRIAVGAPCVERQALPFEREQIVLRNEESIDSALGKHSPGAGAVAGDLAFQITWGEAGGRHHHVEQIV